MLVRSQRDNSYTIREIDALYLSGQQQPNVEVPAPNSRNALNISRNRMAAFITRAFRKEPLINIADVYNAFPHEVFCFGCGEWFHHTLFQANNAVRQRLKAVGIPDRHVGTGTQHTLRSVLV